MWTLDGTRDRAISKERGRRWPLVVALPIIAVLSVTFWLAIWEVVRLLIG